MLCQMLNVFLNLRVCICIMLEGDEVFTVSFFFYLIFYFKKGKMKLWRLISTKRWIHVLLLCFIYAEIFIEIKIFRLDFHDRIS